MEWSFKYEREDSVCLPTELPLSSALHELENKGSRRPERRNRADHMDEIAPDYINLGEKKKKKNFPWIAGVTEKTKQNMQGSWKPNTYMCASSSFYFSCWLISRELNIDSWWVFHKFNSLNRRGALQCPALTIFSPQWTQILRIPPGDDCSDKLVHNRDFYYAHLQSRIFPQPCKSTRVAFHDTGFKIILV